MLGSGISLVALSYRDLRALLGPFQINNGSLISYTVNTVIKSCNIILCGYPRASWSTRLGASTVGDLAVEVHTSNDLTWGWRTRRSWIQYWWSGNSFCQIECAVQHSRQRNNSLCDWLDSSAEANMVHKPNMTGARNIPAQHAELPQKRILFFPITKEGDVTARSS